MLTGMSDVRFADISTLTHSLLPHFNVVHHEGDGDDEEGVRLARGVRSYEGSQDHGLVWRDLRHHHHPHHRHLHDQLGQPQRLP